MTVYFVRRIDDPTQIKIGTANSVEKRLDTVARGVGPIHFFASMPGSSDTERLVHMKFSHLRIEGEWFRTDDDLETYIRVAAEPQDQIFKVKPRTWTTKAQQPVACRDADARCALKLLNAIIDRYPRQTSVAHSLEKAFHELHTLNACWTRRRVRALRELRGLRVDVFEIVDMLTLLEIPRNEWADWIWPKQSRTESKPHDRASG